MAKHFPTQVMQQTKAIKRAIISLFCLVSICATASQMQPFEATYSAFQYGKELGEASLKLESLGRDKFRLSYQSNVSLFFLSDKRQEISLFSLLEGQIVPFKYTYKRTGFGRDKDMIALFNSQAKTITVNGETTLPWNGELDNQLYRLDVQLKLAQDSVKFEYDLINNRGALRHYKMVVVGEERLSLPYGEIESIKVKMIRENSTRETFAWFAPTLNYQLVRLKQFKDSDEQGDIQLATYSGAVTSPSN